MTCSLDMPESVKYRARNGNFFMTPFEFFQWLGGGGGGGFFFFFVFFFFFGWGGGGGGGFYHELESTNVQRSVGIIDPCANYSVLINEYTSYRSLIGSKRLFCLGR